MLFLKKFIILFLVLSLAETSLIAAEIKVRVGEKVILINDASREGTRKVLQVGSDGTISVLGRDGSSFNRTPGQYVPIVDRYNSLIAGLNVIVGPYGNWKEGIRKILAVGQDGTLVLLTRTGEEKNAARGEYIPIVDERNGVRSGDKVIVTNGREGTRKVLAVGEDGTLVFWGQDNDTHTMKEHEYVPIVENYHGLKEGNRVIVGVGGTWGQGTRKILAVGNNGLLVLQAQDGAIKNCPPSEYVQVVYEVNGIRANDDVIVRNVGTFNGGTRKVIAVGKDGRIVVQGRDGSSYTIGPDVYITPDPALVDEKRVAEREAAEKRRVAEREAAEKQRELEAYRQRIRARNLKVEKVMSPLKEALKSLEALVAAQIKVFGYSSIDGEVSTSLSLLINAIERIPKSAEEPQVELDRLKQGYRLIGQKFPPPVQRLYAKALAGESDIQNEVEAGDHVIVQYKTGFPLFGRKQNSFSGIVSGKLPDGGILIIDGKHIKAAQKQRNSVNIYIADPNSVTQILTADSYEKSLSENEDIPAQSKQLRLYSERVLGSGKSSEEILNLCRTSMAKVAD